LANCDVVDREVAEVGRRFSEQERETIWDMREAGVPVRRIARRLGRQNVSVRQFIASAGGKRPTARQRSELRLSLEEREEISRGLAAGRSVRAIAEGLRRSPSTVSREVNANDGRQRYRALLADRAASQRALRPKRAKLAQSPRLRSVVERKLEAKWSPQQISAWLASQYPDRPEMQVSHETIYQSLFVQSRGALRKELHSCLRSGRAMRRAKAYTKVNVGHGQLKNMVMISERPAEVADRAVPGHWEGDLIFGKKMTTIGTLVERHSRYVILLKLPNGHGADAVRKAITKRILTLPAQLRRSITWDQGKEMAEHVQFTVDTGVQIYFCDPKSPWQRGSNENTNGLLRQYLPKSMDLSQCAQRELDTIARSLNTRPRQTLGWMTPSQAFAQAVASTA
jgi:IS30 family transposase